MKIDRASFCQAVQKLPTATFAVVETNRVLPDRELVQPKTLGTSGRISKSSTVKAQLHWQYQNAVENQRGRECEVGEHLQEFTPLRRSWGGSPDGSPTNPIVEHNGKTYLRLRIFDSISHQYYLDGEKVDFEQIKEFIRQRKKGESSRQETEKPIVERDYKLENVVSVTMAVSTIDDQGRVCWLPKEKYELTD